MASILSIVLMALSAALGNTVRHLRFTSMLDLLRSVDRVQAAHTARIAAMFGTEREQIAVHNTNRRSRKIDAGGSSQGRSVLHIHEVEPES